MNPDEGDDILIRPSGETVWEGQDDRDVNRRPRSKERAERIARTMPEPEGGEHGVPLRNRTYLHGARWPLCVSLLRPGLCRGDSVIMKSGVVYRGIGAPDRDNTLVYIWDGLDRIEVRDSRIARIEANNAFRGGETFKLISPWLWMLA